MGKKHKYQNNDELTSIIIWGRKWWPQQSKASVDSENINQRRWTACDVRKTRGFLGGQSQ